MLQERLRAIPLFRDLPAAALDAVAAGLSLKGFGRGSVVFREGDPADVMYVVDSGQVEIVSGTTDEPLATLGPGSIVGESGVLLGQSRSATLRVTADTELWSLRRDDLEAIMAEHPQVGLDLSRHLARRLIDTTRLLAPAAGTTWAGVWGEGVGQLSGALLEADAGRVGVLALAGSGSLSLPAGAVTVPAEEFPAGSIRAAGRVEGIDRLLVVLPPAPTPEAEAALHLGRCVIAFRPAPAWVARGRRVIRCDGSAKSLQRAVRWVTDRAVGIAFSSGGSKTVAHLGVSKVLREAGIPVDAVAGSSGGALAAAGVAFDVVDPEETERLRALARQTALHRFDFNVVPMSAVMKGARIHRLFESWFRGLMLTDARVPLIAVAADVQTGEEVVIDHGPVADALRASMSVPGLLNPWPWEGRRLIDGAVVDPLPARVLREAGVRFVIGSNVAGQEAPAPRRPGRSPNFLRIMLRMINSMERELIKGQIPLVDVMVRPRVYAQSSFDFGRMLAFRSEGERAAREALPEIERALSSLQARRL